MAQLSLFDTTPPEPQVPRPPRRGKKGPVKPVAPLADVAQEGNLAVNLGDGALLPASQESEPIASIVVSSPTVSTAFHFEPAPVFTDLPSTTDQAIDSMPLVAVDMPVGGGLPSSDELIDVVDGMPVEVDLPLTDDLTLVADDLIGSDDLTEELELPALADDLSPEGGDLTEEVELPVEVDDLPAVADDLSPEGGDLTEEVELPVEVDDLSAETDSPAIVDHLPLEKMETSLPPTKPKSLNAEAAQEGPLDIKHPAPSKPVEEGTEEMEVSHTSYAASEPHRMEEAGATANDELNATNVPYDDQIPAIDTTQLKKQYYSISEVSAMFNVNASHLRYWEKEFPAQLGKVRKNGKGDRFYTPKNIEQLQVLFYLVKTKKMTLQGARNYLKQKKRGAKATMDALGLLQQVRGFLVGLKNELEP